MRRTEGASRKIADRRRTIMETAFRLFSENSIDAVSMQRIADESGVSFATMYRYFESKLALVVEIGTWQWAEITGEDSAFSIRAAENGLTGAQCFEQYLDRYILLYHARRDLLRFNQFFNVYVAHEEHAPEMLKPYMDMIDRFAARFHAIYERGVSDGTLRADVPEREMFAGTLHIMMATATRYAVGLVYMPEGSAPDRELTQLKDMMLREYAARQ